MQFLVLGGEPSGTGEDVRSLGAERLEPFAETAFGEAEATGHLGDGEVLIGHHADRRELELGGVRLAGLGHRWVLLWGSLNR